MSLNIPCLVRRSVESTLKQAKKNPFSSIHEKQQIEQITDVDLALSSFKRFMSLGQTTFHFEQFYLKKYEKGGKTMFWILKPKP